MGSCTSSRREDETGLLKPDEKSLNVVLLGSRRVEKIAVGNAILGRKAFGFWSRLSSGCVKKQNKSKNGLITVILTPSWTGLAHTTAEFKRKEIEKSIYRGSDGLTAFALVISMDGPFKMGDRAAVLEHMDLFKIPVWKHTLLLLITHKTGQQNTRILERSDLQWLVKQCKNETALFNKKEIAKLIDKLAGLAIQYDCINHRFEERRQKGDGESQTENALQQTVTPSATRDERSGNHGSSSQCEDDSRQQRTVYNVREPSGPVLPRGRQRRNLAVIDSAFRESMEKQTTEKQDMLRFCSHLSSGKETEALISFVKTLKEKDDKVFQCLATRFVEESRSELIQNVSTVSAITDALRDKKMVTNERHNEIRVAQTSQEKMRLLFNTLDSSAKVKTAFFESLVQNQLHFVIDQAGRIADRLQVRHEE
ncbi:hypothetical protein GJAV_G00090360 [Gymnothorax javanicus]|nr:hypothetical protein GJAV_G00090360 [Gymnothorax javanicus]